MCSTRRTRLKWDSEHINMSLEIHETRKKCSTLEDINVVFFYVYYTIHVMQIYTIHEYLQIFCSQFRWFCGICNISMKLRSFKRRGSEAPFFFWISKNSGGLEGKGNRHFPVETMGGFPSFHGGTPQFSSSSSELIINHNHL